MIFGNNILQGNSASLTPVEFINVGGPNDVANSSSVTIPYPSSPSSGNLLVAFLFPYNPNGAVSASGWDYHGGTSDTFLEIHILSKISDGTESGSMTFSVGVTPSRFFGIMAEYSGGTSVTSVDLANTMKNSDADLFNNSQLPTSNKSALFIACFGTTSDIVPTDTPGNYTKRFDGDDGLNGYLLWDYAVSNNTTEDGDITTGGASSFCIIGGCIIE